MQKIPLYVDIDGTLVRTNIAVESAVQYIKRSPWEAPRVAFWFLHGSAYAKRKIAERITFDASALPYREDFLAFLKKEHGKRVLILASGSDELLGHSIAKFLGIFHGILGSNGKVNLTGKRKLTAIRHHEHGGPFAYAGNEEVDLPIWRGAKEAIVVGASSSVLKRAKARSHVTHVFGDQHSKLYGILESLRPAYWLKNLLILTPLAATHTISWPLLSIGLKAILSFSLAASAMYIVNDIVDLETDRAESWKGNRPLASGRLTFRMAFLEIGLLLIAAYVLAAFLPIGFAIALSGYVIGVLIYSLILKKVPVIDVLCRAGFNLLRIIAGSAALELAFPSTLLSAAISFFIGSAFLKSFCELSLLPEDSKRVIGRYYPRSFRFPILVLGIGASAASVFLFANAFPDYVWTTVAIILLAVRMWADALRGFLLRDPIAHFLTDPVCLGIMALAAIGFFFGL